MNMKFFITIFKHPNTFSICKNLIGNFLLYKYLARDQQTCKLEDYRLADLQIGGLAISRPANWRTSDYQTCKLEDQRLANLQIGGLQRLADLQIGGLAHGGFRNFTVEQWIADDKRLYELSSSDKHLISPDICIESPYIAVLKIYKKTTNSG